MRKKNKVGDFWHWFIGSFSALSVLSLLKILASWAWNKFPPVRQLKRDREYIQLLRKEEIRYLAILKSLVAELKASSSSVVQAHLEQAQMEAIVGQDNRDAREALVSAMQQSLAKTIHQISDITSEESMKHHQEIAVLVEDY